MVNNIEKAEAAIIGTYSIPCKEEYLISFEELAARAAIGLINRVELESKKDFIERTLMAFFYQVLLRQQ